jgi:hypothetical protein
MMKSEFQMSTMGDFRLSLLLIIAKGGEYGHKVGRTLANRVDERRNMIKDYLRGRACIESGRGVLIWSFCFGFEFFLLFL